MNSSASTEKILVHVAVPASSQQRGSFSALTQEKKKNVGSSPLYRPISVYWLNFLLTLVLPLVL